MCPPLAPGAKKKPVLDRVKSFLEVEGENVFLFMFCPVIFSLRHVSGLVPGDENNESLSTTLMLRNFVDKCCLTSCHCSCSLLCVAKDDKHW